MEAVVEKLEASYRGQTKERVEMLRERVEGKLRAEVEAELTEKRMSEIQERLKAELTKLEGQLQQGSGRRAHEELVWVRHDRPRTPVHAPSATRSVRRAVSAAHPPPSTRSRCISTRSFIWPL